MTDAKKIKVMLVDDDKFLLDMYTLKFSRNGLEVNATTGPNDALAKLRGGYVPEILILDMVMPVMDGVELLTEIRKEKLAEGAIAIMLTNQGQQSDIDRAKAAGVHGYIVKASTIPSEVLTEILKIYEANTKK